MWQDYEKDFFTFLHELNPRINIVSSDIIPDSKCLYRRNTKRARCNLAFTIGGEAAPHLLPLTYYLLLSKNPVIDFILR